MPTGSETRRLTYGAESSVMAEIVHNPADRLRESGAFSSERFVSRFGFSSALKADSRDSRLIELFTEIDSDEATA